MVIFSVIKRFSEKYSVSAMCSFYNVSRSGYYSWLRRPEATPKDTHFLKMIEECQAQHKRRYGYRRVTSWLKSEKEVTVNHKEGTEAHAKIQPFVGHLPSKTI